LTGADKGVKSRLTEMLSRVTAMEDDVTRLAIFAKMKDEGFGLSLSQNGSVQVMCWLAISEAAARAGALQNLAEAVVFFDKSGPAMRFAEEVRRQLPGSEFFTLDARLEFVAWIDAHIEPEYMPMYYQQAAGDDITVEFADASNLVHALEDRPHDEGAHPLIVLVHDVALRKRSRRVTREARDWCSQLADLIDVSRRDGRSAERAKLAGLWRQNHSRRPLADAEHATTLMFLLDPFGPDPAKYVMSVWLRSGGLPPVQRQTRDEPAILDVIRQDVVGQLAAAIKQLRQPGFVPDIVLEFFLPRDLLDEAIEEWVASEPDVTLGQEYIVVVRDRTRVHDSILWRRWQEKWNRVASAKAGQDGPFSRWITCADPPCLLGKLHPKLLGDDVASLGLTFPPHPVAGGRHELSEALTAGVPVAVWPRTRCQHKNQSGTIAGCPGLAFRHSLVEELSGQGVVELPRLVREVRRAGIGLALLWDDADHHLPTAADFELDAPFYLGDI